MDELKFKCVVGSEVIGVDYYDNLMGIEIKRISGEAIGMLLSRESTIELVKFLQEKLK